MFEFLGEVIAETLVETVLLVILRIFRLIGATIISMFTFFKKSPLEHYKTESLDKKVFMFCLGLIFIVLVIIGVLRLF